MNSVGFEVTIAPLPEGGSYTPNQLVQAIEERIEVKPDAAYAMFVTGSTQPSSLDNIVWLKDGKQWYVPDSNGTWVPVTLDSRYKYIYIQDSDPASANSVPDNSLWIKTSASTLVAQYVRKSSQWVQLGFSNAELERIRTKLDANFDDDNKMHFGRIDSVAVLTEKAINEVAIAVGERLFRIGHIIENTKQSDDPATELGFGTWKQHEPGRVTISAGSSSGLSNRTIGQFGGQETVKLREEHLPRFKSINPVVADSEAINRYPFGSSNSTVQVLDTKGGETGTAPYNSEIGGDIAHDNMPPFIVVWRWERIG